MRVISQDGTMDFPYDNALVSVYKGCINVRVYVRMQICGYDDSVDVADYSTEEKAKKAMEMLREEYQKYASQNYMKVFQFPAEEELE